MSTTENTEDIPLDTPHQRTSSEHNFIIQNQRETIQIIQPEIPENIGERVSISFYYMIITNVKLQLFILISIITILWNLPLIIIFIYLNILDFLSIVMNFRNLIKFKAMSTNSKKLVFISIIDNFMGIFFKITFYLYLIGSFNSFLFVCCGMIGSSLVKLSFLCILQFDEEKLFFKEFIETICYNFFYKGKFIIFFQFTIVVLKLNQSLDWDWREVFWIFWLYFAMGFGLAVACILVFVSKVLTFCTDKSQIYKVIGIFWILIIFLGFTLNLCLFLNSMIELLDEKKVQYLKPVFFYQVIYTIIFFGYTFIMSKNLLKFIEKVDEDMWNSSFSVGLSTNEIQAANRSINYEKEEKIGTKRVQTEMITDFSFFLKKCSSTYFKVIKGRPSTNNTINESRFKIPSSQKSVVYHNDNPNNKSIVSPLEISRIIMKNLKNQSIDVAKDIGTREKVKKEELQNEDEIDVSNLSCLICFDGPINAVIMDCGHSGLCYGCAVDIMNSKQTCFLCRKKISKVIRFEETIGNPSILKGLEQAIFVRETENIPFKSSHFPNH